jgi:hypothetical protein
MQRVVKLAVHVNDISVMGESLDTSFTHCFVNLYRELALNNTFSYMPLVYENFGW